MSVSEVKQSAKRSIYSMWINWAVAYGAISFIVLVAPVVPIWGLPIMILLEILTVISFLRSKKIDNPSSCLRMLYLSAVILFWTMLVLVIIIVLNLEFIHVEILHDFRQLVDQSQPYSLTLIIYPIIACVTIFSLLQNRKSPFCQHCKASRYTNCNSSFVSKMYSSEAKFQRKLALAISIICLAVAWIYFLTLENETKTARDIFIYIGFPILLYLISLVYMAFRYVDMWIEYLDYASVPRGDVACSTLRFLVFGDDYLCLIKEQADFSGELYYDTPFTLDIDIDKDINDSKASNLFNSMTELTDVNLRLLYKNSDFSAGHNVYHYACFIDDKKNIKSLQAEWFNLGQLDRLIKERAVSPMLASEIKRIYTITMAWKTYTRDGKRLYSIKNYVPTFRLKDLKNWDVDYNDITWINIADNNEDKRFFVLKKLWRKYFSGTDL